MKSAHSTPSLRISSRTPASVFGYLLLLCTTSIASHAQTTADPASQVTDHIHGVVINSVDKKPIARALVTSQDQRMATMTDSQGRFTFDILRQTPKPASNAPQDGPAGFNSQLLSGMILRGMGQSMTVNLTVRRPGYLNANLPVRLSTDPQTTSEDIELKLVPEAIIRGHLSVTDPAETLGVIVQLRRKQVQQGVATWVQSQGMQANSHGDYTFAELTPGDYKVMSSAWVQRNAIGPSAPDETTGYAPAFYADGTDLASTPPIHLTAGQTVEANLNPHASTFYHVTIPVPNIPKGAGINVVLGDQEQLPGLYVNYNSQTQMAEAFLPNGAYDIHIFSTVRASNDAQSGSSGLGRVEVAGKPVKAPPITLAPTSQISVLVRQEYTTTQTTDQNSTQSINQNPDGIIRSYIQAAARRSLDISLQPLHPGSPGANLKNTPNKGDDDLVLDNVQQGTYRVSARPYRGYIASITSNGVDLMRQPLVVGSGGISAPIEVTIRDDSATLTGSVSTTDNQLNPDTYYTITCIPLDSSLATPPPQGGAYRGKFTIPNLAPGRYLVLATTNSMTNNNPMMNIEYANEDILRSYQSKGTVVTLTPGQKTDIQVPMLPEEEN